MTYVARCKCHIAGSTAVRWHIFFNDVNVRSDVLTAMVMEIIVLQPVANMSTFRQEDISPCRWWQFVPLRYRKFLPDYAASHF